MSNRKKHLIPFSWTPASWGLRGPAREEAEAAYYYDGLDLDRELAQIRYRDDPDELQIALAKVAHKHGQFSDYDLEIVRINANPEYRKNEQARAKAVLTAKFDHGLIDAHTCDAMWARLDFAEGAELSLALLEIDLRYDKITPYEHDFAALKIEYPEDGTDRELARLDVEFKHDKIGELAYHKARATLLEEPWVGIVDQGFDTTRGLDGVYFEFDWNEYWIVFLRINGYFGRNDEEVVDAWFSDVCRSQGMGAQLPDASVIPFNGGRGIMNRMPDE
jgi:hypothetical protein